MDYRARVQRTAPEGEEAHEDRDVGAVRVEGDQLAPPPAHAFPEPQSVLDRAPSTGLAARPGPARIAALGRCLWVRAHVQGSGAPRGRGEVWYLGFVFCRFDGDRDQRHVQPPILVGRFAHLRK